MSRSTFAITSDNVANSFYYQSTDLKDEEDDMNVETEVDI